MRLSLAGLAVALVCASACGADPQPEGTDLIPRGIRHGPLPSCEVDANGRWTQPHLAPAN